MVFTQPWVRARCHRITAWAWCLWAASSSWSLAVDQGLGRIYGGGVHAYHAGDATRAYDELTQVIEAGSQDPRPWYFRGLAASKLGRFDEAEADFSTAAAREVAGAGDWHVGRSLERVQGRDRFAIERHRIRAQIIAAQHRPETPEPPRMPPASERRDQSRGPRPVQDAAAPPPSLPDAAADATFE